MTSESIDHIAEAVRGLTAAERTPADATVVADPWIAAAQVHATLAVAEQLRAANVIAYVAAASSMSDGHKARVEQEMRL